MCQDEPQVTQDTEHLATVVGHGFDCLYLWSTTPAKGYIILLQNFFL